MTLYMDNHWNDLQIGSPVFDQERRVFTLAVEGHDIVTCPLRVLEKMENPREIVCQFNPSFPDTYTEITQLFDTIASHLHNRRTEIFQLDLPIHRIKWLLDNKIRLPNSLNEVPLLHLSIQNEDEWANIEVDQYYVFHLSFDTLTMTPTDILLNTVVSESRAHVHQLEIATETSEAESSESSEEVSGTETSGSGVSLDDLEAISDDLDSEEELDDKQN